MRRPLSALLAVSLVAAALAVGATPASAGSSDQAIADAGVLVATDMPATWTSSPSDDSDLEQNLKLAAKIPTCKTYVKFARVSEATTKASSDDFSSEGKQLSNKTYVFEDDATAEETIGALGGPKVADCLSEVFTKIFNAQILSDRQARRAIKRVGVEIEQVDAGNLGDDTVAYEGLLSIVPKQGTAQEYSIGLQAIRMGRAMTVYSVTVPPDSTEIENELRNAVSVSRARLAAALSTTAP